MPHISFAWKKSSKRWSIFLWVDDLPAAEMHGGMSVHYENIAVSQWNIYRWIERFKNGHTSIKHEEGAGPATACMACLSAQTVLVWGYTEDCAVVDQLHQKARDWA
jgi:hypothetical protein